MIYESSKMRLGALEINITEDCNLNCKGCDHAMGILPKRHISVNEILDGIRTLSLVMNVRVLRIIGGEPLLHPNLTELLKNIKQIPFADYVELWTNGTLLERLSQESWDCLDGIVISRYPEQKYMWTNSDLRKYSNKFNTWIHIRKCANFQWSHKYKKTESFSLVKMLYATCREAYTCHTLRNGRFYKCVQAAFAKDRLSEKDIKIIDDGVPIFNNSNLQKDIQAHLQSDLPLHACSYCFGEFGRCFKHQNCLHQSCIEESLNGVAFDSNLITPKFKLI